MMYKTWKERKGERKKREREKRKQRNIMRSNLELFKELAK